MNISSLENKAGCYLIQREQRPNAYEIGKSENIKDALSIVNIKIHVIIYLDNISFCEDEIVKIFKVKFKCIAIGSLCLFEGDLELMKTEFVSICEKIKNTHNYKCIYNDTSIDLFSDSDLLRTIHMEELNLSYRPMDNKINLTRLAKEMKNDFDLMTYLRSEEFYLELLKLDSNKNLHKNSICILRHKLSTSCVICKYDDFTDKDAYDLIHIYNIKPNIKITNMSQITKSVIVPIERCETSLLDFNRNHSTHPHHGIYADESIARLIIDKFCNDRSKWNDIFERFDHELYGTSMDIIDRHVFWYYSGCIVVKSFDNYYNGTLTFNSINKTRKRTLEQFLYGSKIIRKAIETFKDKYNCYPIIDKRNEKIKELRGIYLHEEIFKMLIHTLHPIHENIINTFIELSSHEDEIEKAMRDIE